MSHHPSRQILWLVHGDDFVSVGDATDLKWLKEKLKGRFEIKTITVGAKRKMEKYKKHEYSTE